MRTANEAPPELETFIGHYAAVLSMVRRIQQEYAGLNHALNTRQAAEIQSKTTGGVPKTELAQRLLRLETRLEDYMIMTGRWNAGGHVTTDRVKAVAARIFKIDLDRLEREVKSL